jgi:O-antigen/teichoic acid export membrane protein
MTTPEFYPAAQVIPWIALGVFFQGVYLLTWIGLNITKQTAYYPVASLSAAAASVAGNLVLVPRHGVIGAAWANALAYAVLAGVGMALSQRFYPIRYEWARLVRVAVAGGGAFLASVMLVPSNLPALAGLLLHGTLVVVGYLLLLLAMGFDDAREIGAMTRLLARGRTPVPAVAPTESTELAGEVVATPTSHTSQDVTVDAAGPATASAPAAPEGRTVPARER